LTLNVSAGVASTHGLTPLAYESATARGPNTINSFASVRSSDKSIEAYFHCPETVIGTLNEHRLQYHTKPGMR